MRPETLRFLSLACRENECPLMQLVFWVQMKRDRAYGLAVKEQETFVCVDSVYSVSPVKLGQCKIKIFEGFLHLLAIFDLYVFGLSAGLPVFALRIAEQPRECAASKLNRNASCIRSNNMNHLKSSWQLNIYRGKRGNAVSRKTPKNRFCAAVERCAFVRIQT